MNNDTKCVRAGYIPGNGEPRQIPIVQSTTFRYTSSEEMGQLFDLEKSGYFYTRLQNPTNDHVAARIAELEGGVAAMLTSSGQAANFFAVFNICTAEDFAFYLRKVPGAMAWLGIRDALHTSSLHSDTFDFDENVLSVGTDIFIRLAETQELPKWQKK